MDLGRGAPLGTYGVIIGLAAAATFMPDGCRINDETSLHLRIGLPIITPIVFFVLGLVLSTRRGVAFAQALGAVISWCGAVALIAPLHRLDEVPLVPVVLGALVVGAIVTATYVAKVSDPWPAISVLASLSTLAYFIQFRSGAKSTFDLRLAWATIVLQLALSTATRKRSTAAFVIGTVLTLGAAFVVLRSPPYVPSSSEPLHFSLWHC